MKLNAISIPNIALSIIKRQWNIYVATKFKYVIELNSAKYNF